MRAFFILYEVFRKCMCSKVQGSGGRGGFREEGKIKKQGRGGVAPPTPRSKQNRGPGETFAYEVFGCTVV